jgi:molecular chaperone DnaJ
VQGHGKGDLLISVNVWTPQNLSLDEKKLLEQLKHSPNFKPNPGKSERGWKERMKEFFQ